jgi:hypothetical protein
VIDAHDAKSSLWTRRARFYPDVGARRTLKRASGALRGRTIFCIEGIWRPHVSNRNTAKIENDRRTDIAKRRAPAQAGALGRPADVKPITSARRAKQRPLEDEIDLLGDPSELTRPPLHGKVHPPAEMNDATPTLDDEVRHYRHHPNDAGATEFGFDPEAADAAADLAGDLGSQFLEGATRGEDLSSRVLDDEDRADSELPFIIEDELALNDVEPEPSDEEMRLDEEGEEETERP